ncbi:MAG: ATP-binding protein, partial [Candidatus Omnitrophica bacterium]|nr:ATP-binding protein [Candidatus Omnitrophota bacterium]
MRDRALYYELWQELNKHKPMIFISGPRQSGKTTLAKQIAAKIPTHIYTNWDVITDRKRIHQTPYFFEHLDRLDNNTPLIIFDEIHKYRFWKRYLKGVYDRYSETYRFLVLGSGRLDVFQKGGDSLAGRYFQAHIFPLTIAELANRQQPFDVFWKNPLHIPNSPLPLREWEALKHLTGFPEPFFNASPENYERWSNTYAHQLIREDIRDLTQIKNIDTTEALYFLLPSKVGSLLSIAGMARDLQVSFGAVKQWLAAFERFYLIFRLSPWVKKISRTIRKEQKLYLMDYGQITDPAARLENMTALELMRATSHWNDRGLGRFALHYIRDKEQREVDFLITNKNIPLLLVETKLG